MIPLKPRLLLLQLILAASTPAAALQILDARDGETVAGKISQKDVTRIAFDKSRIRKVTGNAGDFVLDKDEERGQIFIRPSQADATRPIQLFITGDHGTVGLLLQPVDAPGDTVLIREHTGTPPATPQAGRAGSHIRALKNLLLAMASEARPAELEIIEQPRELRLWPDVRFTLQRSYLGQNLTGERYQLVNLSGAGLDVSESQLHKTGVMAVSIEQRHLEAGEATAVFVIRERHSHE